MWAAGNIASGSAAGATSLAFVYPLEYARTRLSNDSKAVGGGSRQYNGIIDVWRKTLKSDGIVGIYRGFNISCGMFIIIAICAGLTVLVTHR